MNLIFKIVAVLLVVMLIPESTIASIKSSVKKKEGLIEQHFKGNGVWIYNEIMLTGNNYEPFVDMAKDKGMNYVIIKAYDGAAWGTRNKNRHFTSQLNDSMAKAFHRKGIKCYAYGTANLRKDSDIKQAIQHAVNTLHKTSVDGLVLDDVFARGQEKTKTEQLFSGIRGHLRHCKQCQKKPLAFSTFPHVASQAYPWGIPFKYSDYYLPQLYWTELKRTPTGTVAKFQSDWSNFQKHNPKLKCRVIPVGQTIGKATVTPEQINTFVRQAKTYGYQDFAFYRWDGTSLAEWQTIKKATKKKT
ncbi:MAG: hypothetical protein WCG01_01660 [bacterium]